MSTMGAEFTGETNTYRVFTRNCFRYAQKMVRSSMSFPHVKHALALLDDTLKQATNSTHRTFQCGRQGTLAAP